MSARTLVYRSMLFAPAAFLVALGVHARSLSSDFDFVANDPCTEHRIQAYVPYLQAAQPVLNDFRGNDYGSARQVAAQWICGAEKGVLKPLPPVAYEDTSCDGVKGQLEDAESRIARRLQKALTQSVGRGDVHQATADALQLLRLANILKESDFISLFNEASQQRRALESIKMLAGRFGDQERAALREAASQLGVARNDLDMMVGRSNAMFIAWRRRTGCEPLSIEDTRLLANIPVLVESGDPAAIRQVRQQALASRDDHVPTYCSSLRLGLLAQGRLNDDVRNLKTLLAPK